MADRKLSIVLTARDAATPTLRKLGGALKWVGGIAAGLAAVAIGRNLVEAITRATAAAGAQERAEVKVAQALRNRGLAVDQLLPKLKNQAAALQTLTGVGDEVILAQQEKLIAVAGLQGDALERATKASLDMAASTGNVEQAFDLVAKAGAGYTSTLSRYGILIDESIPKSEKFTAALAKIESMFGGQAAAKLTTYDGKLEAIAGRWGDLQEAVGGLITTSPVIRGLLDQIDLAIQRLTASVGEAQGETVLRGFVQIMGTIAQVLNRVSTLAVNAGQSFRLLGLYIKAGPLPGPESIAQINDVLAQMQELHNFSTRVNDEIGKIVAASLAAKSGFDKGKQGGGAGGGGGGGPEATTPYEPFGPPDEMFAAAAAAEREVHERLAELRIGLLREFSKERLDAEVALLEERQAAELESFDGTLQAKRELEAAHEIERRNLYMQFHEERLEADRQAAEEREDLETRVANTRRNAMLAIASASGALITQLFGQNKAAATAAAIINTAEGVTMALKSVPPPYSYVLAALTAAKGAAEIATIQSQNIQRKQAGGIITGSGGVDSQHLAATPGESVLTVGQTQAILGGRAAIVPMGSTGGGGRRADVSFLRGALISGDMLADWFEANPNVLGRGFRAAMRAGEV